MFPSLRQVGGDLNIAGNRQVELPKIETIGGNFIIALTGMEHLPPKLNHVGGDVIISDIEPESLLSEIKEAKKNGIIRGNIIMLITQF